MSRRHVKRYEESLAAAESDHIVPSGEEKDGASQHADVRTGPVNMFSLLGGDGDGGDDDNEVEQDDEEEDTNATSLITSEMDAHSRDDAQAAEQLEEHAAEALVEPKRKSRRRRKKKSGPAVVDPRDDPDWIALNEAVPIEKEQGEVNEPAGWIPSSYFAANDDEAVRKEAMAIMARIEVLVHGDKLHSSGGCNNGVSELYESLRLLHVEPRTLNADSELKRLFGARAIESERRGEEATRGGGRGRRGGGGGRSGARAHSRRKVSLVSPRDNWVGDAPGLTMVLDEDAPVAEAGVRYFKYAYEGTYQRVQQEYRICVGTHDPNTLVGLASQYPFHVDSLLQLAELYRQMGELDRAAEQIERCLYVLETSWNIAFKPYNGDCRLRFDIPENRSLYVALFRYAQLLTRRGLHRTALETCKLLLNLSPDQDPMGVLMLADSFALLAGEYEWIQAMHACFRVIPVRYFPNFALSAALAGECQRTGVSGLRNRVAGDSKTSKKKRSAAEMPCDASGTPDSPQSPRELLTDALLTFPMALRPLLAAIQDESGVWTEHRLYDEAWHMAGIEDGGVLLRMTRVYAERSKLLWNSPHNRKLLVDAARAAGALDTAAGTGMDPATGKLTSALTSDRFKHSRVANCRALRAEAGRWLCESGMYRDVQVADFTDGTTNLPAELLAGDGADQAIGAVPPRQVTVGQGALEFLRSLLPWREAGDAAGDAAGAVPGAEAGENGLWGAVQNAMGRGRGGGEEE